MYPFRFNKRVNILFPTFFVIAIGVGQCFAAQNMFTSGKSAKVEADAKKDYYLTESDGNWFAMVKKFSGDSAYVDAKRLAYELRAAYKMNAFVFKYDPDKTEMDALSKQLGRNKKFRYKTSRAVEYAVLVGGFPTGEDLELQKTLDKIRKIQPKSLKDDPQSKATVERFKATAKTDPRYAGYGPLGGAIPVPNPLLPSEFFNHKGVVDPFVAKLNSDSKYSLLNNKKTYTVRIATFSGDSSMKRSSESFNNLETRLQYAGLRAAALCEALRNQGVEAWEFHDRDCSFVTIGSFDQYGTLQQDGHTELNPKVAEIMKKYGGSLVDGEDGRSKYKAYTIVVEIPDPSSSSFAPKKKKLTIACDLRPVIIVVPQRSGEENVKKIALATEQMDKARKQMEENAVERSLEVAEDNLESAQQFAHVNGQALTEEEYLAWAARMTSKNQNAQKTSINGSYTAQTSVLQDKQGLKTNKYAPTSYQHPEVNLNSNANPTSSAVSKEALVANSTSVKKNGNASGGYTEATKKETPVVRNPYETSVKAQKTARRSAAPTY